MKPPTQKTILVAPLNWGLGHATRCIPIINTLIAQNYRVIIASDGDALAFLELEFPEIPNITLPSYRIKYPKDGKHFKKTMLQLLPSIHKAIKEEKKIVDALVRNNKIQGIISDNRLGVRNSGVTSIYMTHQLTLLSGGTTWWSSKLHLYYINKFNACWVPDVEGDFSLSGKLGQRVKTKIPIRHIGSLSRMKNRPTTIEYDILIILSGPEPQRSLLETLLKEKFITSNKRILLVQGVLESKQEYSSYGHINIVNYLTTQELETVINKSELVICRSGYTSIMDLAALDKKCFLIPTPGQFEQEYLARRLQNQKRIPSCAQDAFEVAKLEQMAHFTGWKIPDNPKQNLIDLLRVF